MHQVKKISLQSEMMVPALTSFKTNTNQKRISDGHTSGSNTESGFSNVPLTSYSSTPNSGHLRRSSNTSMSSDISYLPHYESPSNLYHVQSDLDISASEVEDNASTSSQLGHLTKEQIYSSFKKSQLGYHKYRGRYTDIAKHYKDLERENSKIRSVLVETQDKALRRISELREQCSLEQKAKAHLENSLRVELDEKQYIIDSLKTKVHLLHKNNSTESDQLQALINLNDTSSNNEAANNSIEVLTKDLKEANTEIENLAVKIQELKANSIIFSSKETEFKKRIGELEELNKLKSVELSDVLERERENNLIIAQTKMELHTEIQNRDLRIENLKHDVETLKSDLDISETKLKVSKTNKLENYQSQNTKLIEKVEELTQKCNNYESDLLKMEQFKIENKNLQQGIEISDKQIGEYARLIKEKENLLEQQKLKYENELLVLRDDVKQNLLTLETKIKNKLQDEFNAKEKALTLAFEDKIQHLTQTNDTKEAQLKLLEKVADTNNLEKKQRELEEIVEKERERYNSLETNHLELISESSEMRCNLFDLQKKNHELMDEITILHNQNSEIQSDLVVSKKESSALLDEKTNLCNEIETIQNSNAALQNEATKLRQDVEILKVSTTCLQNENGHLQANKDAENLAVKLKANITDLRNNINILQEEKSVLIAQHRLLENENIDLQSKITKMEMDSTDLIKLNETINMLTEECSNLHQQLKRALETSEDFQKTLTEKENVLIQQEKVLNDNKVEMVGMQKILDETHLNLKELKHQKLDTQQKLKEETVIFHKEIRSLNNEISKFKDYNNTVQGYIDEYKLKLTDYEERFSESAKQLQNLINENSLLRDDIAKLNVLLDTSNSNNTSLTQQLNNAIKENSRIIILEEFINSHIEDKGVSFEDKIKLITELNTNLKQELLLQEEVHTNLSDQHSEVIDDNKRLREQMIQLEKEVVNKNQNYEDIKVHATDYEEKCRHLNDEMTVLNKLLNTYKGELSNLQNIENYSQTLQDEKAKLDDDLTRAKETIDEINTENCKLAGEVSRLQDQEKNYVRLVELQNITAENARILEEMSELKHRNDELVLDYKQITAENEEIVIELAETKLKSETLVAEKFKYSEIVKKIEFEKADLLNELKQYRNELDRLKISSVELENIQEMEDLINDNKNIKSHLVQLEERCESCEKQRKILEGQLRELENQYAEILHEKQLLQDEIQELKISPVNIIDIQRSDNFDVIHSQKNSLLEISNGVKNTTENHQREIDDLNEKLVQYKSLDLTNRSSLQFYENELQKLRNKNDKLNRKLDETLVTLNHCAELSHSTETEYLKNVLYNYMLGKESVVLARVIAAVCKFDESQTNAILQREHQKQTLFGQLGLL